MGYWLDGRGSISGRERDFSVLHAQPRIQWVSGALFLEVKRPECGADHPPPSSVEVKNGRTPLPHIFHGIVLNS
jgi:hypothetical protein